jgi:predicted N-acetyltransferase YhbS
MSSDDPAESRALIRRALSSEADAIAEIVRESFQTVADEIGLDIPPTHEDSSEVLASFDADEVVLVAQSDSGQLVGTVRGETIQDGLVVVRRLAVLPQWRGRGIGGALVLACEEQYPEAHRFELFTGAGPEGAVDLYERLGYALMRSQQVDGFPLVYMEKRRQGS